MDARSREKFVMVKAERVARELVAMFPKHELPPHLGGTCTTYGGGGSSSSSSTSGGTTVHGVGMLRAGDKKGKGKKRHRWCRGGTVVTGDTAAPARGRQIHLRGGRCVCPNLDADKTNSSSSSSRRGNAGVCEVEVIDGDGEGDDDVDADSDGDGDGDESIDPAGGRDGANTVASLRAAANSQKRGSTVRISGASSALTPATVAAAYTGRLRGAAAAAATADSPAPAPAPASAGVLSTAGVSRADHFMMAAMDVSVAADARRADDEERQRRNQRHAQTEL